MITFATMKEPNSLQPSNITSNSSNFLLRRDLNTKKRNSNAKPKTWGLPESETGTLLVSCHSGTRSYYNSLNQLVIEITHTENTDIEHNFEFGRPVCFFRQSADGKITYMNFTATVSYADETRMVAIMPR